MTGSVDSTPKTNIVDFKPKSHLTAESHLKAFIAWARETLPKGVPDRVYEGIRWEDDSWHQHGFVGCSFTALASTHNAPVKMEPPFTDFAKALLVYRRVYLTIKSVKDWFFTLKALDAYSGERERAFRLNVNTFPLNASPTGVCTPGVHVPSIS